MSAPTDSPMSSREAVRAVFLRIDVDGDGLIDRREFVALLDGLGAGLSQAEAEHAFTDVDADGNGAIDFDEFCRFWRVPP